MNILIQSSALELSGPKRARHEDLRCLGDREGGPRQIVAGKEVFFLLASGAIVGVKCVACRFLLEEQLWNRGPDAIGSMRIPS